MGHGLAKSSNMVYRGEAPWHRLGIAIDQTTRFSDVPEMISANYTVGTRPLFRANEDGSFTQVKHTREVYREDTGVSYGGCGPQWQPLQNAQAFEIFQPFIDEGLLTLQTAGILFGGECLWILCGIEVPSTVAGDQIESYVLLSNWHARNRAIRVGLTQIRTVCFNTLSAAENSEFSRLCRVKHNRLVAENVENLVSAIDLAKREFEMSAEQFQLLAQRGVSKADLRKYVRIVLDMQPAKSESDLSQRSVNILDKVCLLAENGIGNAQHAGTWWAAYNGLTQYLTHIRGRNDENRLDSLWFGKSATQLRKALETAVIMSTAA